MNRLLKVAMLFSLTLVLVTAASAKDNNKDAELELVCPPHAGDFPGEPGIKDRATGTISRINDSTVRAVAKRTCDVGLCGNGIPEAGEQCDTAGESATCDSDCTAAFCGDGQVNVTRGEQCDDGNDINGDGCSSACLTEVPAFCGNGIIEGLEQCDDGNANDNDDCTNTCSNPVCGDSIVWNQGNGTEECDEGVLVNTSTCDLDCTQPVCGDGIRNVAVCEQCDDGNTVDGDGCSSSCEIEGDFSNWTEEQICQWAASACTANFLDQLNAPGDDKVIYCHATSPGKFNYLDTNISSCFPHIDHPGDVFASTLCDS